MLREDIRRKLFQRRSVGGWIMLGLWLAWQAVNAWSNTEFLITKQDAIMGGVGAVVASRALQWILLIGGVAWILATVRRAPHPVVPAGPLPHTPTGTTTAAPRFHSPIVLADGRIILDVTPYDLTTSFNEHTEIQRPKLLENFIGKWINASGSVDEVLADPVCVVLNHESDRPFQPTLVFVQPNAQWVEDLPLLRKGQTMTVRGRIWLISRTNVHLEDCELLDL